MGAKESKPSCINYEDAVKRVSDTEFRRIRESFKRSSNPGGHHLSLSAFLKDVLCEGVPTVVGEWLFTACGGTSKGISFKDLLCGLVLLTRGTHEEKIKLLWNLYCNDSGTHILKSDYLKLLNLESNLKPQNNGSPGILDTSVILLLFQQSDKITFDQFREWITRHKNATVLSKWLLSESTVALTSELETPTFYQSLAGVTHLEEADIGDLEKVFWRLKGSSTNGQLDIESIGPLLSPPIPKSALLGLFNAFDENRDGHIDFKELCCGVSAACRGPSVERSKFCFKVFDIDRDGVLNYDEINQMVEVLIFIAKESSNAQNFKTSVGSHVINDIVRFSRENRKLNSHRGVEASSFLEGDQLTEFHFNQEDFMMWSIESPLNLVQPFLDLFFEVCHIVFGLRPQCKHLEYDIVKEWLSREKRRGYKVGQFWYLIAADWWQSWLQYTQNITIVPCTYCKQLGTSGGGNRNIAGLDEAMICDESFTSNSTESMGDLLATADSSSLGSSSSGISYGRRNNARPGPIDNSNLVTQSTLKNVPTLTGEGGHLKKDTPLTQRYDFELVPESLWKALSRWYGDPLPLPRQVIQPCNAPDVELELYPLNLRILRHYSVQSPAVHATPSWGIVTGGYGSMSPGSGYSTIAAAPQPPKRYVAYTAAFSRLATVRQIGEFLCDQLKLKPENIRLWHILKGDSSYEGETPCLLEEENMTLQELIISDGDQILLEIRNKDLTWPEELGSLSLASYTNQERRLTTASIHSVHALGATGLHNLGNTCFMNSALQVMFNTQPLTRYFKNSLHAFEMNTTNKLGTKGQLATRYGELLREIWTTNTRSVAPLKLRFCVTKHAPQFAGGGQHDSQELLEWLLDALHEDLNRVTEKPYMELKDSAGRPDEIVAAEAWSYHHSRNQSIVIDLFYGQLKSKVSCLCCGRESVRFDPFSLLSLPLPVENFVYCEILVILLNGIVPVKYGIRLNADSKYFALKRLLSPLCNLSPYLMLLCEISNSQVKQILSDDMKVSPASAMELVAYQIPEGGDDCQSRNSSIIGINIEKGLKDIQRNSALMVALQHDHQTCMETSFSSRNSTANDEEIKQLSGEIEFDKEPSRPGTSKQSAEISTSPESTFTTMHPAKRLSMEKVLSASNELNVRNLNRISAENHHDNASDEICVNYQCNNEMSSDSCPCRLLSENREDIGNKLTNHLESEQPKLADIPMNCREPGRYLIAVHRKLIRQDTYFLSYHKSRPSLFGVPLLIPCYENGTNKDLYCAVWVQVNRLLTPLPLTPDQANHAADCDDSLGYDFPFTLRAVSSDGLSCALCPWSNFCRGCEIPCNDEILFEKQLTEHSNALDISESQPIINPKQKLNISAIHIAIDWDPTALHLRYQSTREKLWTEHETVAICRRQQTEPVDLDYCLRAFTSEEKLEQWYHCGHCKGKKPATKKLQIWKLPPILIIHLKRFNCVNGKWVKSQKVVNFPFENFDPTPYLASVPQETILRHKELLEMKSINDKLTIHEIANNDISQQTTNRKIPNCFEQQHETISETISDVKSAQENTKEYCIENDAEIDEKDRVGDIHRRLPDKTLEKRKRLISTSLTRTPVIDGHFVDFHQHKVKTGEDPFELKYNLYAVVSHSGMLNGGHYVSYTANPNGLWYCYNDSSCREIRGKPNIDPSSAYLLLYERKNLDYEPYFPNVEGRSLPNGNMLDTDDSDADLKKLCVIS